MVRNPGKTMTIYDIPGIVALAYPLAASPVNIQAGFRVTGIHPFNRDVFEESDFLPSFVTDRPVPIQPALPPNSSTQPPDHPGQGRRFGLNIGGYSFTIHYFAIDTHTLTRYCITYSRSEVSKYIQVYSEFCNSTYIQ